MANKDLDKKRLRISSAGTDQAQIGTYRYIKMSIKECQDVIQRLTAIKDKAKISDERVLNLESRLEEAQDEIQTP